MAVPSDQELLDAAKTALKVRLDGDAFEGYSTLTKSFRGAPISEIQATIDKYERKLRSRAFFVRDSQRS